MFSIFILTHASIRCSGFLLDIIWMFHYLCWFCILVLTNQFPHYSNSGRLIFVCVVDNYSMQFLCILLELWHVVNQQIIIIFIVKPWSFFFFLLAGLESSLSLLQKLDLKKVILAYFVLLYFLRRKLAGLHYFYNFLWSKSFFVKDFNNWYIILKYYNFLPALCH